MASSITNLKYKSCLEHTLSFESKLSMDKQPWTIESPLLNLHDERQFIIKLSIMLYSFNNDEITVILQTAKDFCFKGTEKITVFLSFNAINLAFEFATTTAGCKEVRRTLHSHHNFRSGANVVFEINMKENSLSPVLIKDFNSLLDNEQYTDLTINVDGKHFKVHKNIIWSRNKVLPAMLKHNMIEKERNSISLSGYNPDVVKEFLTFLYTGTCKIIEISNIELFKLADYLDQSDLQELIEEYMKQNIHMSNFVSFFEIADLHNLEDLYSKVKKFFLANQEKCVKIPSFDSYLRKSVKLSNIKFVLDIAYTYKMDETLNVAMDFVAKHYTEFAKTAENLTYIQSNSDLLLKLFEHSVRYLPNELSGKIAKRRRKVTR